MVISQKVKLVAFYGRKLTDYHKRYIVTENELLSIVETLKVFRTILPGQRLIIYTGHKHLMWKSFNTDRVLRWILILEEYGTDIEHTKSDKIIAATLLSRYPPNGNQETTQEDIL